MITATVKERAADLNVDTVAVLIHRRVRMTSKLLYFMNSGTLVVALCSRNLMACSSVCKYKCFCGRRLHLQSRKRTEMEQDRQWT